MSQTFKPQRSVKATYMRGGTSKGTFFNTADLPQDLTSDPAKLDAFLLRLIGSPDPYGKHTDGMGGATSSTSKAVFVGRSTRAGFDVDYRFAQVAIDKPKIDWSGNCGNLSAAVGAFAIHEGLVNPDRMTLDNEGNGFCEVRVWQVNIEKQILIKVPITQGQVQETGDFILDGVAFPAARIEVSFVDPVGDAAMYPTGNLVDELSIESLSAPLQATLINAGIPTVFVRAEDLGFRGTELQGDINSSPERLNLLEDIRLTGAVAMGLAQDKATASHSAHTPKVAFVSAPKGFTASSGTEVRANQINLNVRAMSMGQLHHAMMGTAAVAIAAAAATPGTLLSEVSTASDPAQVTFGHPSGTLDVSAQISKDRGVFKADLVGMARSARRLMVGEIFVPV